MDTQPHQDQGFADLMRSAQGGDKAAYERLLREIVPLLKRAVRRKRPFLQSQDVDDLVQNILFALHSVRATYDPRRPFLPWLMAIARNHVADGARRYARRATNEVCVEQLPETFSLDAANMNNESYGDPEELLQAMVALPAGQRRAVELLKLKEMSLKEAAVVTGMSVAALKVAMHRGMQSLRRVMGAEV